MMVWMILVITVLHLFKLNPVETKFAIVSIIDNSSIQSCLLKIHSILRSTRDPTHLSFHFLLMEKRSPSVIEWNNIFPNHFGNSIEFETKVLNESIIRKLNLKGSDFETGVIFCRFFLPHVFSSLDKFLYLDNDLIVTADIMELNYFNMKVINESDRLVKERFAAASASTSMWSVVGGRHDRNAREKQRKPPFSMPTIIDAPVAFVVERHPQYVDYLKTNFDPLHPLVQRAISLRTSEHFLNGGVALFNAKLWRQNHWSDTMRRLILQNAQQPFYSTRVGDQGPFFLGLQEQIAYLPAKWNMRRLPKKTVHMLEEQVLGIVHFAGTTHGDAESLCREPLRYPIFLANAVPLYLSVVTSFQRTFLNSTYRFSNACDNALVEVILELKRSKTIVKYNPGLGNFSWPP